MFTGQHRSVFKTSKLLYLTNYDSTIVHLILGVLLMWQPYNDFLNFILKLCNFNYVKNHTLLTSQVLFLIMSKLWNVYCLEITILVGCMLNTNNKLLVFEVTKLCKDVKLIVYEGNLISLQSKEILFSISFWVRDILNNKQVNRLVR